TLCFGVNALTISARRNGDLEVACIGRKPVATQPGPRRTFVRRPVDAGAELWELCALLRRDAETSALERRVHDARIRVIEAHVGDAGVFVDVQRMCPRASAVGRAVDPARGVRAAERRGSQRADDYDVRVVRIDEDGVDVVRTVEPDVAPGLSRVGGFVDSLAGRERPARGITGTDVDDVGIGFRYGERADRSDVGRIEDRLPHRAAVDGLPNAAFGHAGVVREGLAWRTTDCVDVPRAVGP